MIGNGEKINGDLYNICKRIKAVDSSYMIVRNYKTNKFEIHSGRQRGNTLALVIPYDRLDDRTIKLACKTRVERKHQILKQLEESNRKLEQERISQVIRSAEYKLEECFRKG